MEQRREPRFELDQAVTVTILGDPEVLRTAKVKNRSGRGLGLEMAYPVGIGDALKIEFKDSILLGEVMYCRGDHGSYYVGLAAATPTLATSLSPLMQAVNAPSSTRLGTPRSAMSGRSVRRAESVAQRR